MKEQYKSRISEAGSPDAGPVISVQQMRDADAYTIAHETPSLELMRRAAQGVFDAYDGWEGRKTLIICGSGNNGGDGYALASILSDHGFLADVLVAADKFSPDGQYYYGICREKGIPVYALCPRDDARVMEPLDFTGYDNLVDCLFGTGFAGEPREPQASVIRGINRARGEEGACVISVDINSGMNGDTGEAVLAVTSDLTVSIGYFKHGFFKGSAPDLMGRLVNVDIGITLPE